MVISAVACSLRSAGTAAIPLQGFPTPSPGVTAALYDLSARAAPTRVHEHTRKSTVANIKSQMKRIKTNEKARLRNKAVKSELKTYIRKVREAVAASDKEAATAALAAASRKLDKAVSKGVIHSNQAANRKSALAKLVNSL